MFDIWQSKVSSTYQIELYTIKANKLITLNVGVTKILTTKNAFFLNSLFWLVTFGLKLNKFTFKITIFMQMDNNYCRYLNSL